MPAKANPRNHRNSPYVTDGWAVQLHRSAAGVLWRFRTEVTALAFVGAAYAALARKVHLVPAAIVVGGLVLILAVLPWTRRFLVRRAWCVMSRHRIQKVCFETRMHTRSGRLPLVLRIHPTEVGERALIWCRAGICFEDFEAHTGELAAACYAREARIERSKRWAQIVTVQIVRRDTLAAHTVVAPDLAPAAVPQASDTTTTTTAA
jgi:hypothetical protein